MIARQPGSQSRSWLEEMLQLHDVHVQIGAEFDNVESIKRATAMGHGLTILPDYTVRDEQRYGALRAVPITGRPLVRTLKLIWNKRRHFSPVTRSLLMHLNGYLPGLGELLYV
jgi:DNA-binding transcriptional LysR family regulator